MTRQRWPRRPSLMQIVNRPGDYVPDDYIQLDPKLGQWKHRRAFRYIPKKPEERWAADPFNRICICGRLLGANQAGFGSHELSKNCLAALGVRA